MVFTKMLLENALAIQPYNYRAVSEPLLPKVARCILFLSSRSVLKCAALVLKRSERNQSDFFLESRGHSTRIKKFSQNGRSTALPGLREDRPQYILKTRIMELQTCFSLATVFR